MFLIILLAVLTVMVSGVTAIVWYFYDDFHSLLTTMCGAVAVFMGVATFIAVIVIPFERADSQSYIDSHYALRDTVEEARASDISEGEQMSLSNKISDHNEELAQKQYYANNPWYNVYHQDEVTELEPIR